MPPSPPPSTTSPASSGASSSSSAPSHLPRKPRVTAEHTLTRVRENQRRHRARRRDHIASLEQKLADTEAQLAAARVEIEALKRERDAALAGEKDGGCAQAGSRDGGEAEAEDEQRRAETMRISSTTTDAITPINRNATSSISSIPLETDTALFTLENIPPDLSLSNLTTPLDLSLPLALPTPGPPPCCTDLPTTPLIPPPLPTSPECSTCHTRPLPLPSESTMLCAQAYLLIQQQNFRGIDAGTIRLWLYQGYRRAQREGEGCRVENGALFRLLDYISGM